jgi:hypothetical protein
MARVYKVQGKGYCATANSPFAKNLLFKTINKAQPTRESLKGGMKMFFVIWLLLYYLLSLPVLLLTQVFFSYYGQSFSPIGLILIYLVFPFSMALSYIAWRLNQ